MQDVPHDTPTSLPPASAETVLHVRMGFQHQQTDRPVPEELSSFRVLRVLGEGGMGIVYCAQQDRPRRLVALKVLKAHRLTPESLRRFHRESEALGHLQHPGIAQIYTAGTANGVSGEVPFIAMELVQGTNIVNYAGALPVPERLRLLLDVCDAVAYAHGRGIIHRDLKPSNVLVDSGGRVKVLDFGLSLMSTSEAVSLHTEPGQLIGTLAYMSPEQALGKSDLDARTDIYALGVLAFELLSGHRPYEVPLDAPLEAIRRIVHDDTPSLYSANRNMRGDLDTIVAKALEKDRDRRYARVSDLAGDIRRYLEHQPIMARRPTATYRTRKLLLRHKGFFLGMACVMAALVLGVIGTTYQAVQATARARESELRLAEAKIAQGDALLAVGRNPQARGLYMEAWDRLEKLGVSPATARLAVWDVDRRQPRPLASWHAHGDVVNAVTFADGDRLAISGSNDGTIKVWDLASLKLQRVVKIHRPALSFAVATTADVVAVEDSGGGVSVLNIHDGNILATQETSGSSVILSPDGRWIAWRHQIRGLFRWCWAAGTVPQHVGDGTNHTPVLIDNGGGIVAASPKAIVRWTSPSSAAPEVLVALPGTEEVVFAFASGDLIVTCGRQQAYCWDLREKGQVTTLHLDEPHRMAVLSRSPLTVATLRRGGLVQVSGSGTTAVLSVSDGEPATFAIAAAQSGALLLGDKTGGLSLWTPLSNRCQSSRAVSNESIVSIGSSPGGKQIVALSRDGHASLLSDSRLIASVRSNPPRAFTAVAMSPDGNINLITDTGELLCCPTGGTEAVPLGRLEQGAEHLAASPDGARLAYFVPTRRVRIVSFRSLETLAETAPLDMTPLDLQWGADSNSVLITGGEQIVRVNARGESTQLGQLDSDSITSVQLDAAQQQIFVGTEGGKLRRVDLRSGQERHWKVSASRVVGIALSEVPNTILTCHEDGIARWLDRDDGHQVRAVQLTSSVITSAKSARASELTVGTENGEVIWISDALTASERASEKSIGGHVSSDTPAPLRTEWFRQHGFTVPAPR